MTWTSSIPNAATVSPDGVAATRKVPSVSTTILRATSGGLSTANLLTVTPDPSGLAGVLTYHNDPMRTGENRNERILSPSNVNPSSFGEQFSVPVDGNIYAQPLYVPHLAIPGKGIHNVVFVSTQNNSLYAFDAENPAGETLWHVNLGPAVPWEAQPPGNCNSIAPKIGITSTPGIDPPSNTIYVVARTFEPPANFQYPCMRSISRPALNIQAVPPLSPGTSRVKGLVAKRTARPSIHLFNCSVPVFAFWRPPIRRFASNCDYGDYHGWVFVYNARDLSQESVFITTPNGESGGIWQAGAGPAIDPDGKIYVSVADGSFEPTPSAQNYGDTFLKLAFTDAGLHPSDYFAPYNQQKLDRVNLDLGIGRNYGFTRPCGSSSASGHRRGKEGTIYLADRDNMGHQNDSSDAQIVQSLTAALNPVFSTPAIWQQDSNRTWVYYNSVNSPVRAYALDKGVALR